MNEWSKLKIPFFFLSDYALKKCILMPLEELSKNNIFLTTPNYTNTKRTNLQKQHLQWEKSPISFNDYQQQFNKTSKAIQAGETYLLNLTCATPIQANLSLLELFNLGKAKYKLYFNNQFIHFSPEPFVQIKNGKIYSYPMKGTIDANLPNAKELLRSNEKELREQFTIVDLIRNDLSSVAQNVRVNNFRYIEEIQTNQKKLLAMSSKISGNIRSSYDKNLGSIFEQLLPAGSITGAPKKRTIELIAEIETHQRNFYTGVWGIFDGENTDSCVIIRYIESTTNGYYFKSGGGITSLSNCKEEYQEMIDKVYFPLPD